MTNTMTLRRRIAASGYKIGHIARKIGITPQAFGRKLRGKNDFSVDEAKKIADMLGLSGREIADIFFANNVDFGKTSASACAGVAATSVGVPVEDIIEIGEAAPA